MSKKELSILNKSNYSYNDFSRIVGGYLSNSVSESDMESWIKLIFERGMSTRESADYTKSIINTGVQIKFPKLDAPIVDKHSTGGVGDKISLILGPLLASYGYYVPMIVGTSLGHTGGTLDKLCSIPGYQPYLPIEKFKKNVESVGVSIMGQTTEICPGDKKIYELRDRMNMIDSYPLICGSIMSKKIAEGIQGLILDIKTGNGAFMHTVEMATKLGTLLKNIGELNGLRMCVAITDMNQPLGKYSGVGCEILESIECLKGRGDDDVMRVVFHLASELIMMFEGSVQIQKLNDLIKSGKAYDVFVKMIEAHGGSLKAFENKKYNEPPFRYSVKSNSDGYIQSFQTRRIGEILSQIGAGTLNNSDGIDDYAGLTVYKKISDSVSKGESIMDFYCSSNKKINNLSLVVNDLYQVSQEKYSEPTLIY